MQISSYVMDFARKTCRIFLSLNLCDCDTFILAAFLTQRRLRLRVFSPSAQNEKNTRTRVKVSSCVETYV